jgi:hypothetical protein
MTAIPAMNPRTLALPNYPRHSHDHRSAIEPSVTTSQPPSQHALDVTDAVRLEGEGVIRAQNVTARHLEQQRSVQLGEIIAQITALREQLGSDVATAERDRVLHNQLTNVLNMILRLPHERGVAMSREDALNQVTRSMPGKWMVKIPRAVVVFNSYIYRRASPRCSRSKCPRAPSGATGSPDDSFGTLTRCSEIPFHTCIPGGSPSCPCCGSASERHAFTHCGRFS